MPALFRFDDTWTLPGDRSAILAALAAADAYPTWWREVRHVERESATTGRAAIRSVLPYTLSLRLTAEMSDLDAGVLRTRIEGDLRGWAQFTVPPGQDHGCTLAAYAQEVTVEDRWVRPFTRVAAPVLRANHAAMMRSGERGLRAHLSGLRSK